MSFLLSKFRALPEALHVALFQGQRADTSNAGGVSHRKTRLQKQNPGGQRREGFSIERILVSCSTDFAE